MDSTAFTNAKSMFVTMLLACTLSTNNPHNLSNAHAYWSLFRGQDKSKCHISTSHANYLQQQVVVLVRLVSAVRDDNAQKCT